VGWFIHLGSGLQIAVITGAAALLAAVITAFSTLSNTLLQTWLGHRRADREANQMQQELYRRYANPLTGAAVSLYWRLKEVFEEGRSDYLKSGGGETRFERHKASSTRYRIAAVLGWIAALRHELVLANAKPSESADAIRTAISAVQTSLAEGVHVERASAERLAIIWGVELTNVHGAGVAVDFAAKRALHKFGTTDVGQLEPGQRSELLHTVATALSDHTTEPAAVEVIASTEWEAMAALSTREAWIYRDWQDAIGEWMLLEVPTAARRYDVRGYLWFSEVERLGEPKDAEWLLRLSELTKELDIAAEKDARVGQLRGVYVALAELIQKLDETEPAWSDMNEATRCAVATTVADAAAAVLVAA
jgi:hypothetical protein